MKRTLLGLVLLFACNFAFAGIGFGAPGGPGVPGHGPGGPGGPGHGPGGPGHGPGPGGPGGPGPGGGSICFFENINFSGQSFCVNAGTQVANLVPSGWNDKISSLTVNGPIGVYVYQDVNYGGSSLFINRTIADIRNYGAQWNDLISSFAVTGGRVPPPPRRAQICFYEGVNYSGQSFCLIPDQQQPNLVQSGWNDRISSIWVDGDASVYIYQDINFSGAYLWINQSIANLSALGAQYNDWISSMNVVRANGRP